jgi:multimeric flavodoxin WrbA
MNIVAINGSYRGDQGHTHFLIDRLFQGARRGGAECQAITLAYCKINRCLACGQCQMPEHYLQCVYHDRDDVADIFRRMAGANLLIYATPVYVFGISGLLKTLIDRMYGTGDASDFRLSQSGLFFHHIDANLCSKPFVTLVCCDNVENATPRNVLAYFETYSEFMDAPQVGVLVRNGGQFIGHGRDPQRARRSPKTEAVYAAYTQAGYELATEGRVHRATQRRASQEVLPVPFFGLLKNLRPFKRQMLEHARQMMR